MRLSELTWGWVTVQHLTDGAGPVVDMPAVRDLTLTVHTLNVD